MNFIYTIIVIKLHVW